MIFFTKKATLFMWLICFFAMMGSSFAQDRMQISGRVIDAQDQKPLGGVTIVQKGTTNGVSSQEDGRFQISVPAGTTLLVTYVGYDSKEVLANTSNLTVQLSASTNVLDDVVVIGYGSVKRKDVTTAISSVSTQDLEKDR